MTADQLRESLIREREEREAKEAELAARKNAPPRVVIRPGDIGNSWDIRYGAVQSFISSAPRPDQSYISRFTTTSRSAFRITNTFRTLPSSHVHQDEGDISINVVSGTVKVPSSSLDRSKEFELGELQWTHAASIVEGLMLKFHGEDVAGVWKKHHEIVRSIGITHNNWKIALIYDHEVRSAASERSSYDVSVYDVNRLTSIVSRLSAQQLSSPQRNPSPRSFVPESPSRHHGSRFTPYGRGGSRSANGKRSSKHCFRCGQRDCFPTSCTAVTTSAGKPCVQVDSSTPNRVALKAPGAAIVPSNTHAVSAPRITAPIGALPLARDIDPCRVVNPIDPVALHECLVRFNLLSDWGHMVAAIRFGFDVGVILAERSQDTSGPRLLRAFLLVCLIRTDGGHPYLIDESGKANDDGAMLCSGFSFCISTKAIGSYLLLYSGYFPSASALRNKEHRRRQAPKTIPR
ncbi:hypothetical protein C8J56DRAFT_1113580 [Mycena floridula]|nr:hypothetical protein C8J56DRAFT_1113580 [Mycena floridula]